MEQGTLTINTSSDELDLFAEDLADDTLGVESLDEQESAAGCFSTMACFGSASSSTKGTGSSFSSASG